MFVVRMREHGLKHRRCRRERIRRRGRWTRCEQCKQELEEPGLTDALSPGIRMVGQRKIGEYQVRTTTHESTALMHRRKMEHNEEDRGSSLFRSDQRSCRHIQKVLSSLVLMFTRVTLVFEMPGNGLLTLLVLLILTTRFSGTITTQQLRKQK